MPHVLTVPAGELSDPISLVIEMSRICPYVPGGSVVTPIASVTPIPQREPIEGLATLGDS